jgi:hypothetical protein
MQNAGVLKRNSGVAMRIPKPAALFAAILLLFSFVHQPLITAEESVTTLPPLLITEVQTGGLTNAAEELVELYNPGNTALDLNGWQVQYMAATGTNWISKADLSGTVDAGAYYIVATTGYIQPRQAVMASGLSANGGHIRLITSEGIGIDMTSWGSAMQPETAPAEAPQLGMNIQRCVADNGVYVDSDDNGTDYGVYSPTPGTGIGCLLPGPETPPVDIPDPQPKCQAVVFSEILPNPKGTDAGAEFIELLNTSDEAIDLEGCQLLIGSQEYVFPQAMIIDARSYLTISDTQTDIQLPNSTGGTLYLLDGDTEVATAGYPQDMPDGSVWMHEDGQWAISYSPTPGEPNVLLAVKPCPPGQTRSPETGRCGAVATNPKGPLPCKQGQIRNPDTNRCRAVAGVSATLTPCKPGQTRNPATNRCRASVATASALVPCKPGQERNPDTNRCRSLASTVSSLKPCTAGQERSPETNRCRKVAALATAHPVEVKDVASNSKAPVAWWLFGAVGVGAASYAIYEWRHEILKKLQRVSWLPRRKK